MESEIAQRLQKTIPPPAEPVRLPPPAVPVDEQSSITNDAVNELSLLKIGNYLGLPYPNAEGTDKLTFIHDQLKGDSYDKTLQNIDAKLLELGLKFAPDRFHKLWLWLKLNQERQAIDNEMSKI